MIVWLESGEPLPREEGEEKEGALTEEEMCGRKDRVWSSGGIIFAAECNSWGMLPDLRELCRRRHWHRPGPLLLASVGEV